jgi:O-acetylserine/cysteine efflux transporter
VLHGPTPHSGVVPRRHVLLACLVATLWGLNFLAIHASLQQFPPIFLVALRFAVIAVPVLSGGGFGRVELRPCLSGGIKIC